MWNNFCAVVLDLFWFAFGMHHKQQVYVYGYTGEQGLFSRFKQQPNATAQLAAPATPILLTAPVNTLLSPLKTLETAHAHSSVPIVTTVTEDDSAQAILYAPVIMYVSTPTGTPCLVAPAMDFDVVIETLAYGTAVTVIGYQGRFTSVNRSNITGWVDKEALTPRKNTVWPAFVSGADYNATASETIMTRTILADTFGAGLLELPLQAGEYVTVRLKSEHLSVAWSRKRPRVAGSWATLLRGTVGIHIGVTPKTDTIIEWQAEGGEGRLGYVEAVAPDLAITISAVGIEEAGRYTVKTMSEEIWRELRPVFIEVA